VREEHKGRKTRRGGERGEKEIKGELMRQEEREGRGKEENKWRKKEREGRRSEENEEERKGEGGELVREEI
jgi:hypothetical protein